jgi:flagellar biosynthesis/type III secretory pathway protein FliH
MEELTVRLPAAPRAVKSGAVAELLSPRPASVPLPSRAPSSESEEIHRERLQIEAVGARIQAALRQYTEQRAGEFDDWRRAAVELAVAIAARVLRRAIDAGEFPIEQIVHEMIGPLVGSAEVSIYLNPRDLRALENRLGDQPPAGALRLVADPALGRGDCRVEDGTRMMVARLPEYLREVREEMIRSLTHDAA